MSDYNLHSEFNLELHNANYVHYLEVIIYPNGRIEYAIPSHQEKLISILTKKWKCSREDVFNRCPRNMWLDFEQWLLEQTKCVAVWYEGYHGNPNRFQRYQLNRLMHSKAMKKCNILLDK